LIAQNPVTLTTYNDETLFRRWLSQNAAKLSASHGSQLRHYGLWLVTRTYAAPKASINAWLDKDKEANMSVKVKASMMGELGGNLDWTDKLTDKDWSHYGELKKGQGIVLFFDGIEIPAYQWWWQGIKGGLGRKDTQKVPVHTRNMSSGTGRLQAALTIPGGHSAQNASEKEASPAQADLWGSETPLRDRSPLLSSRNISRGRPPSPKSARSVRSISTRKSVTPTRFSQYPASNEAAATINSDSNHLAPANTGTSPAARLSSASTAIASGTRKPEDGVVSTIPELQQLPKDQEGS